MRLGRPVEFPQFRFQVENDMLLRVGWDLWWEVRRIWTEDPTAWRVCLTLEREIRSGPVDILSASLGLKENA